MHASPPRPDDNEASRVSASHPGADPKNVSRMRAHVEFWRALLRDPFLVGAVVPSSRYLGEAMIDGVDLSRGAVVEFGPGTGALTEALHQHMPDRSHYLGIEFNARFVALLKRRFPDLAFHHGSAEDFDHIVHEHGLPEISTIISGVPFASLPDEIEDGIIAALERGMPAGTHFRIFQYAHSFYLPRSYRFREKMAAHFGAHTVDRVVVRNIPPAFVISWTQPARVVDP